MTPAANIYDQLLGFLRTALRSVFVLGVVAAIGAWLSGPGETATKIRDSTVGLFRGRERAPDAQPSAIAAFVSRHRSPLRVVVAGVGLAILVVLSHPGPIAVLIVAIIVLVGLAIIEALSRNASSRAGPSLVDITNRHDRPPERSGRRPHSARSRLWFGSSSGTIREECGAECRSCRMRKSHPGRRRVKVTCACLPQSRGARTACGYAWGSTEGILSPVRGASVGR